MLSQALITLYFTTLVLSAPLTRRALDLGTCKDATVKFANGLDGRNTPAFAPNDPSSFSHGSALNLGVISGFICSQLGSACKAPQATVDACNAGAQAASSLTGQAAADAFNAAVTGGDASASSGSAASDAGADAGAADASAADSGAAAAGGCAQATVTVTAAAAASTEAAAGSSSASSGSAAAASSADSSASAASGANLQTFTGALGGPPPPVVAGGKGFIIDGSEFINKAGALKRSCDVQHNTCANAANSGQGNFSVADCDAQDTACSALATN